MMHTICLIAMSSDFLDSDLPKPEFSREDFLGFSTEACSSRLGGASFLMFTTLSTIFVPINTGLTSSSPPPWLNTRLLDSAVTMFPFLALALGGEHDFCLGFTLESALGLPLDADEGLLGTLVFAL